MGAGEQLNLAGTTGTSEGEQASPEAVEPSTTSTAPGNESSAGDAGGETPTLEPTQTVDSVDGAASPADTPAAQTEEPKPDGLNVLLDPANRPQWLEVLLEDLEGRGGTFGVDLDNADLATKQAVAEAVFKMQAAQQAAKANDEAVSERAASVESEVRTAQRMRKEALDWAKHQLIEEFMGKMVPEGAQPDPSSPEGMDYLIRKGVHDQMTAFFDTLGQVRGDIDTAQQQAEKDAAFAVWEKGHEDWFEETAEMQDPQIFDRVQAMLKESGLDPDEPRRYRMDPKRALKLVLAELAFEQLEAEDQSATALARKRVAPGGGHGRRVPAPPKGLSNDELAEYYEGNPDARKAAMERFRKAGLLA